MCRSKGALHTKRLTSTGDSDTYLCRWKLYVPEDCVIEKLLKMNSYNKIYLEKIAKEKGFVRDNLEKVMRLSEILQYFNQNEFLHDSLVLKGGTAINLTVFRCHDYLLTST